MDQAKIEELENRIQILEKKSEAVDRHKENILHFAMQLARGELFQGILNSAGKMEYFNRPQNDIEAFKRIHVFQIIDAAKSIIIEESK
jgi:hypothetical protein